MQSNTGPDASIADVAGIDIQKSTNITVLDCSISNSIGTGIVISHSGACIPVNDKLFNGSPPPLLSL